ncbi:hypothetical protein, partial [Streptomyces sp. NPDC006446]|uniref:hypothetical protein n=1 Tax=Streptomyces sp. NPDC006446 TaxID=3154301 RepID=UPI0033BE26D5
MRHSSSRGRRRLGPSREYRPTGRPPAARTRRTDPPYGPAVRTRRTDPPYGPAVRTRRTDPPYG